MRKRHRKIIVSTLVCLFLVAITLAAYWQAGHCGFVNFDDDEYVTANPRVQAGLTLDSAKWAFTSGHAANWHPLTWLSHMLDCQLFGMKPAGHHWMNVAFHAANALLLFLLLSRMTKRPWLSAFVAAVFALHPLQVESVAWVSERKNVLSTFFWLLTLLAYVRYAESRHKRWYLLSLLLFAIGLMAKPMLVTLPFVLLLLDAWPLRRTKLLPARPDEPVENSPKPLPWYRLVLEKIPFLVLAVTVSIITLMVQQQGGAVRNLEDFPITMRLANAIQSYLAYIGKIVFPVNLAVFYPFDKNFSLWRIALTAWLLVLATGAVVMAWNRRPYLTVGWLWYLGVLVPVIGIIQVGAQSMADRYAYVPLIGVLIMAACSIGQMSFQWKHRYLVLGTAAVALLATLGYLTSLQVAHWKTSVTLFEHALAVTTNNAVAHNNLGLALSDVGKFDDAIFHHSKAIAIDPRFARAHNNLGIALAAKGKFKEATDAYAKALHYDPANDKAHVNMANALVALGAVQQANRHFNEALRLNPDSSEAHNNLGNLLLMQGRLDPAIRHYTDALRTNPRYAEAHNNLGYALSLIGKFDEAIEHYEVALTLKPDYSQAHNNLGTALLAKHEVSRAILHYRDAIRFAPNSPAPFGRLATVLSAHPDLKFRDGAEAVQLAQRACELTENKHPLLLATLATAYAETGRFKEAIETVQQALQLLGTSDQGGIKKVLEDQLQLYREGKPFRMTPPPPKQARP